MAHRPVRRRSVSRRPGGSRRGTNWGRLVETSVTTIPAASKVLLASFVLSNPGIAETVVRTLGRFSWMSDQVAVVESQLGAFGMVVVSDIALAAGAASIPGPVTEATDDGWFVWESFFSKSEGLTTGEPGFTSQLQEYESRAARRVEEGFSVAIMVENGHATAGMQFWFAASMLAVVNT